MGSNRRNHTQATSDRTISNSLMAWSTLFLVAGLFAGSTSAPIDAQVSTLPCVRPVAGVTWIRWTESEQRTLDNWCAAVGPPVFRASRVEPGQVTQLQIVSWNIHVGGGRVEDILERLRRDAPDSSRTGLVLLLQEAYRGGADVPDSFPPDVHVPGSIHPRRPGPDITALAERFALSVAYVPSMRNGRATGLSEREDRGNAVLSTEPLSDVRAIELPFGKQRRVAVAVTVTPRGSSRPLRVVVTHLDTSRDRVMQATALGTRLPALQDLPLVIGADLNARKGLDDAAVQTMTSLIPIEPCGTGRTVRFPLRLDRLGFVGRPDFMFSTLGPAGILRACTTLPRTYGSDHLPLLLTIQY